MCFSLVVLYREAVYLRSFFSFLKTICRLTGSFVVSLLLLPAKIVPSISSNAILCLVATGLWEVKIRQEEGPLSKIIRLFEDLQHS